MKIGFAQRIWRFLNAKTEFRATLLYAAIALAWLLVTDRVMLSLSMDTRTLELLHQTRDWLFFVGSAAFIFWLINRQLRENSVLNAVGQAAQLFLRGPWQEHIQGILSSIGSAANVSRAYLFRKHTGPDGSVRVSQLYEWVAPGVAPQIDNPALQSMELKMENLGRWIQVFETGGVINAVVGRLPREEQREFIAEGIRSILCAPVMVDNEWWGFLGFDDCLYPRDWNAAEVEALQTAANILGAAIQRARSEEAIRRHLSELTVLHSAALAAAQIGSPEELIAQITGIVGRTLQADHFGMLLPDAERTCLTPHSSYQGLDPKARAERPPGDSPASRAMASGQPFRASVETGSGFLPRTRSEIAVPVQVGGRLYGLLHAGSAAPGAFTERDERLLVTLSGSLSTALERIEFIDSERRRRREAETLNQTAAVVSSSLELRPVLDMILSAVQRAVPYDSASIFLLDGDLTKVVAAKGFEDSDLYINKPIRRPSVLFDEIRRTGQPIIIPDTQADPRFVEWSEENLIHSWLAVPLVARGDVIGFLTLDSHRSHTYNQSLAFLAQTFAYQAATAIQNARLFEAEAQRRREAETLRQAAAAIALSLEPAQVLDTILAALRTVVPYDSASVYLLEKSKLVLQTASGFPKELGTELPQNEEAYSLLSEIHAKGKAIILGDAQAEPRFAKWGAAAYIRAWMGVPLMTRGEVIGFLTLDSGQPNAYQAHDADQVQAFANQAAAAIQNARLYQQAVRAAERRAVLHRLSQDVVQSIEDLEQTYSAIHRATRGLMDCDAFMIALRDEARGRTEAVYIFERDQRWPAQEIPAGQGLTNRVIEGNSTVSISDLIQQNDPRYIRLGSSRPIRSILATPMRIGDRVTGVLSTQSYQADAYGQEEQELLEMLATQAATAVENARLFARTSSQLAELEGVTRVSAILRRSETLEQMLPELLNETLSLLQSDTGGIWLYQPSGDWLKRMAGKGWIQQLPEVPSKSNEGILGYTLQTGRIYFSDNLAEDPRTYLRARVPPGWGGVCTPIHVGKEIVGIMFVGLEIPRRLRDEEVGLLNAITEIAGNAIHRARLFSHAEKQVRRLTALRDIDAAIASSFEAGVALSVLIDHVLAELRVDAADVLLLNPAMPMLTYEAGRGFRSPLSGQVRVRVGTDLAGRAILERKLMRSREPVSDVAAARLTAFAAEGFADWFCAPLVVKGQVKGVLEIFHRAPLDPDPDWLDFLQTLAGQAAIALDNMQLFSSLQRSNQELALAYDTTLEGWGRALELRDKETEGHTRRVANLTLRLAHQLGVADHDLTHMRRGVLLHDIGKMGVPDEILKKTGPLNEAEWVHMRQHPQFAYDLLAPIPYLQPAIDIPYCHHEKWDGSGYPRGLKGEEIPLAARIFAVVDVWDALRYDRPYRDAWTREKVIKYISEESGTRFDPAVADAFLRMVQQDPNL